MRNIFVFTSSMVFAASCYASYKILSENDNNVFSNYSMEELEIANEMQSQFDANGYYKTYSEAAVGLRDVEYRKANGLIDAFSDPYYEILRPTPSGFPLIFTYPGILSVDKEKILGYVPSGTETPKTYKGKDYYWTGVTGYFSDDEFGTCRHVVEKIGINPNTEKPYLEITYDSSRTSYDVNKKPTTKSAQGNEQSGYIYEITWTGKNYDKGLECSNTKPFDSEAIKDLIEYAKKLDMDLPDPVK
jgi:hypothetical protein